MINYKQIELTCFRNKAK